MSRCVIINTQYVISSSRQLGLSYTSVLTWGGQLTFPTQLAYPGTTLSVSANPTMRMHQDEPIIISLYGLFFAVHHV